MLNLKSIQNYIQNIAESISTVINIDVTIVDENLERIAGTGKYYHKIGTKITKLSSFGISAERKTSIVVENPGIDEVCTLCEIKSECTELGEICCPIIIDNKAYGVIGLIAFDEAQKNILSSTKSQILNYLNKTADLISNKLKAEINTMMLNIDKKRLEQFINNMEKPLVSTDRYGNIDIWNYSFEDVFSLNSDIKSEPISKLLNIPKLDSIFGNKVNTSLQFTCIGRYKNISGVLNIKSIDINNEIEGYTLYFTDNKSTMKDYATITNYVDHFDFNNIIGHSPTLTRVKEIAIVASQSSSTTLITGESGTGKELFARAIHSNSKRSSNAFIAINCAAIPEHLLESELFGYEEGSFSGAKKGGKPGKFELADKGTLFLDEIGDMSLHLQSKLLRVLQEKRIDKIGSCCNTPVDVRVICATNKDLEEMVSKKEFREDLYYRLNVLPIHIPPLRERRDDIGVLINHLISIYSRKMQKDIKKLDPKALSALLSYPWPGNVRELQNALEYSINMCNSDTILFEDIPECILIPKTSCCVIKDDSIIPLKDLEKTEIQKALLKFKDFKKDKEKVAEALGISRATLYRKMKEYDL